MSDVDQKSNELLAAKREALKAFEAAVVEHTVLNRDLEDAEKKVETIRDAVERALSRRGTRRTLYEQAEMAFTDYRVQRERERAMTNSGQGGDR